MDPNTGIPPNSPSATIVLIHGLWMTPLSWEHWKSRYEAAGYTVLAPPWPGVDGSVQALRSDPSPLAILDAATIIDHYDRIIRALDAPPIIMGHSFGGAFTQVLLDRGLGAAGVGIDAAGTKGVLRLPVSTLRSSAHVLVNPFNLHKAVPFGRKQFRYAFGNTMTEAESDAAWERYAIPAAAHVLFEGAMANVNPGSAFTVDYHRSARAPLLFIAGGRDHVVPASVNRSNVKKYAHSGGVVALKEFPGRSHFTVGENGWEEVADYALSWAAEQAATHRGAAPHPE